MPNLRVRVFLHTDIDLRRECAMRLARDLDYLLGVHWIDFYSHSFFRVCDLSAHFNNRVQIQPQKVLALAFRSE